MFLLFIKVKGILNKLLIESVFELSIEQIHD